MTDRAQPDGAEHPVDRHGGEPEDLRQAPHRRASFDVHLPETVLRLDEPERHQEIVIVPGIDLRDSERISNDRDRILQSFQQEGPRSLRKRSSDFRTDEQRQGAKDDEKGEEATGENSGAFIHIALRRGKKKSA